VEASWSGKPHYLIVDRYDKYKKRRKKRRARRILFWAIILVVLAALYGGWRLWSCLHTVSPQFNFIFLAKNESRLKLVNGEVLRLHPNDRLKILKVSTNVCFNRGVRLAARGFDANALLIEEMPIAVLLPDRDVFNQYSFRVNIKQFNQVLGHVGILVEPHIEDWLERAERIIDGERRVAFLERALELMPKDDRIRNRLLDEYKSLKDWKKAASILEHMAQEKPDEGFLYDLLEIYESTGKKDKVTSVLKRIIKKHPDDVDTRLRLASTLEKRGKLKEATREYERLLKRLKKEDSVSIYKKLGYLYTKTNQPKEAISNYLKAVELDKKDANLYYNLSYLYEKDGQTGKADLYLEKAVHLKSGDVDSRLKLAESLIKKGKFKEAEKHLSAVLKKNPKSVEALLLMINIQEKTGDREALKKTYDKILALEPKNETIIYNLGVLEYETGNLEKSLTHFRKFLKSHPRDAQVRSFLFDIYRKQKKDDLAFKEAQALITLQPKEISYYRFMFEYLDSRTEYEKMIEVMKSGLKSYPNRLEFREYLMVAYLKTGKEDLASEQMEEILKQNPKDVALLLNLARLKEKQGKLLEALQIYEKILEISPDSKEGKETYIRLLLQLAKLEEEKGQLKKALEAYKKVLDISPGHEEAEEAYLRLRLEALPRGGKK
jgi:tetratricopeptide (TPR) repeat protein